MALVHQRGWDPAIFGSNAWFSTLSDVLLPFLSHVTFPALDELDVLLERSNRSAGLSPLRVVWCPPKTTHRKKRRGVVDPSTLYDVRISEQGELPTRVADFHDFFNVLSFAAFPRSKRALHTRQSRLLRARIAPHARRLPGARTREQDALTLLDEGGVLVACDPRAHARLSDCNDVLTGPLEACLRDGTACLVPFGHALFEHLVEGLPCPLAVPHLVRVPGPLARDLSLRAQLDVALCEQLQSPSELTEPSGLKGVTLDDYAAPFV